MTTSITTLFIDDFIAITITTKHTRCGASADEKTLVQCTEAGVAYFNARHNNKVTYLSWTGILISLFNYQ